MTTRKLLWGMAWRGTGCGCITGLGLGIFPGCLCIVSGFVILLFAAVFFPNTPAPEGEASYGIFLLVFMILIYGALLGIAIGLVTGIVSGIAGAILTSRFSLTLNNRPRYRMMIGLVSVASSLCFLLLMFLSGYIMLFFDTQDIQIKSVFFVLIVILPALLSMIDAFLVSQFVANWYERESTKGIARNVSSN